MSFTKEKREKIRRYILEKIDTNCPDVSRKTADTFHISLTTVYRYVKEMEEKNIIKKHEDSYILVEDLHTYTFYRSKNEIRDEDLIYSKYVEKEIADLPENVQRIWCYAFTEMMNNAIDHSEAEQVNVSVFRNYLYTTILLNDNGIGIFKKIKEYYNYKSLDDAVTELFKGKLTTDSKNHSGEGIFFTSRALDKFAAVSDGKIFSHDNYIESVRNLKDSKALKSWEKRKGTVIFMGLSNHSKRTLKEVFDMFADVDGGFTKTHIPIKHIYEDDPVSRSQAKRLCNRFDSFQEVELDFNGVDEIGQGFAHEIFVVFQNRHKNVKLIPVNESEEVKRMINHVILSNNDK